MHYVHAGHVPYPGMMPIEVKTFVVDQRGTMANTERFRPVGCPPQLLNVMELCWK